MGRTNEIHPVLGDGIGRERLWGCVEGEPRLSQWLGCGPFFDRVNRWRGRVLEDLGLYGRVMKNKKEK